MLINGNRLYKKLCGDMGGEIFENLQSAAPIVGYQRLLSTTEECKLSPQVYNAFFRIVLNAIVCFQGQLILCKLTCVYTQSIHFKLLTHVLQLAELKAKLEIAEEKLKSNNSELETMHKTIEQQNIQLREKSAVEGEMNQVRWFYVKVFSEKQYLMR